MTFKEERMAIIEENKALRAALIRIQRRAPKCAEGGNCEDNPCIYRLASVALRRKKPHDMSNM